ncbi:uncharacterized protein CEXT_36453 [Caerostris extrusa]|uniref:PDZ domain-containing protein n=1 Tax=Caerostris extrusa TaxID=172846 RepID=A0AAV4RAW3_CAEEX|nr:uncharacterized protein CEXT_36453 [Caerostris extrusa]
MFQEAATVGFESAKWVRRKSKSYKKLFENDLILSVNDHSVKNLTYDQVMEIADKSGTDLTLEIQRRESNKENFFPANCAPAESILRTTSPLKTMENEAVTKEVISLTETASKRTEEKEGIRIKSATLLPEKTSNSTDYPFENFTSQKLNEEYGHKTQTESKPADPFPSFSELLSTPQGPPKPPRSPVDTSTSSKTEEIRNDDNTVTKITTETMHEIKGNTEMSFTKKEQESVSKNIIEGDNLQSITSDAIDLNNLISATQKKLESFKNGIVKDTPASNALKSYDVQKNETISSTSVTESKSSETFSSINQSPLPSLNLDSANKTEPTVQATQNESEKKVPLPPHLSRKLGLLAILSQQLYRLP